MRVGWIDSNIAGWLDSLKWVERWWNSDCNLRHNNTVGAPHQFVS